MLAVTSLLRALLCLICLPLCTPDGPWSNATRPGAAFSGRHLLPRALNHGLRPLVPYQRAFLGPFQAPVLLFVAVIFLFPALLCLVFVPLYLLDLTGLQCVDCQPPLPSARIDSPPAPAATHSLCHVLLYSLSLSMLFGGSPVQAHSRYTLLVANLQTLVANFTFVFLSGAGQWFSRPLNFTFPFNFNSSRLKHR